MVFFWGKNVNPLRHPLVKGRCFRCATSVFLNNPWIFMFFEKQLENNMSHITHKHSTYAYALFTVPSGERIHIPPKSTRKIIDSNIPCTWGYASSQEGSLFTRKESEFQLGYLVLFKQIL